MKTNLKLITRTRKTITLFYNNNTTYIDIGDRVMPVKFNLEQTIEFLTRIGMI